MERIYTITLKFNQAIPHPVFETKFEDYINSSGLFVPEETAMRGATGTLLSTKSRDGVYVRFDWYHIRVESATYVEELEAIKNALRIAKQLESVTPPFNPALEFNPNVIYMFVGRDSKGKNMPARDFIPHAEALQRKLYYGGNIAYTESSGDFGFFFGVEEEIEAQPMLSGKEIVGSEGTAQPARSLDELLQRLGQKPQ